MNGGWPLPTVLALDVSGSTGWAVRAADGKVHYGVVKLEKPARAYDEHPWGYYRAAWDMAGKLWELVDQWRPNAVFIEEINIGRNRFSQKFLDYCHFALLEKLNANGVAGTNHPEPQLTVTYVNTSDWRHATATCLTREDKNRNARLARHKRKAASAGRKLDKKALGIQGRTTIKHVAVRRANELYGLSLKTKDDDAADALLLLRAALSGVKTCTGSD